MSLEICNANKLSGFCFIISPSSLGSMLESMIYIYIL